MFFIFEEGKALDVSGEGGFLSVVDLIADARAFPSW